MRHVPVRFVLLFAAFGAFAETSADMQIEGNLCSLSYSHGHPVDWGSYEAVTVYGVDAKRLYFQSIKESEGRLYRDWTVDSDGTGARIHKTRMDLLDSAGKTVLTIDTGTYLPQHVAFGPDHSIWTVGYYGDYQLHPEHFPVVRHYSAAGDEIGRALPWSKLSSEQDPFNALQSYAGSRGLFATRDRIGFPARLKNSRASWIVLHPFPSAHLQVVPQAEEDAAAAAPAQ